MSLEGPKKEKPKSSINNIVGASAEKKEEIFIGAEKIFAYQNLREFAGRERGKTAEEAEIVSLANEMTNELFREYGQENFDIPEKNVHIIKDEKWIDHEDTLALMSVNLQSIAVKEEVLKSKIHFLAVMVHEMLHFKSHQAAQMQLAAEGGKSEVGMYKMGLQNFSRDGKKSFFIELNEAITEMLNRNILERHLKQLKSNKIFADEIKNSEYFISRFKGARFMNGRYVFGSEVLHASIDKSKSEKYGDGKRVFNPAKDLHIGEFTYRRQRQMLDSLIDKVWKANSDKFKERREVFDIFVRAYMNGNMLPMGRLIEKTFGKGSFRKIGELDMSTNKAKAEKKPAK